MQLLNESEQYILKMVFDAYLDPLENEYDDLTERGERTTILDSAIRDIRRVYKKLTDSENEVLPDASSSTNDSHLVTGLQAERDHPEDQTDSVPAVTLYTAPGCPGCQMTLRAFEKADMDIAVVNLADRPDLVEQFKREGLLSAPIIEDSSGARTSGFRPDRIRALIDAHTSTTSYASNASHTLMAPTPPRRNTTATNLRR